uniref:Uncharacterized protein n=1 Tax=Rhodosorus marinus TaxID=101924 RepID=A0A6T6PIP2_9RHOD|mmetsp:Transcript_8356/g.12332  ORF Transcript_8356/g.12332 Transcript_8356/m.12332 type:complete len:251 (+) Transcript_8356:313-1065(+)
MGQRPLLPCGYGGMTAFSISSLMYVSALLIVVVSGVGFSREKELLTERWGYATLVDYSLSVLFVALYFTFNGIYHGTLRRNIFVIVGVVLFGHIVTMAYLCYLTFEHRSLRDALIVWNTNPDGEARGEMKRKDPLTWIIAGVAFVLFLYFLNVCVRALQVESLGIGWEKTKGNPWILLTFINNLIGLVFVVSYILVSEQATFYALPWILALVVGGNGVSMLYVVHKMLNNTGASPLEAMLTQNPRGGFLQ